MSKKSKRRVRRGRPQSAPARSRPRKGPPPRPAQKPAPESGWQRLRRNRPLFYGSLALAGVIVAVLAWLIFARPPRGEKTVTPTAPAEPTSSASLSWPEPPAMAIDPSKQYTATIVTDKGDITVELFADRAPKTVNSFVFLARQGYYDGVTFHRVLEGFMAQGGDRTGTGGGGPGYTFEDEIDPDLRFESEGLLAMANAGADTNGSQFFITYSATPGLDGQHTIFGRVVEGMDVARSLTPRDPDANPTFAGDRIKTVRIAEG